MHTRIGRLFAVAASLVLVVTVIAVAKPPLTLAATHVTNPWYGATMFVNPDYQAEVNQYVALQNTAGNTALAAAATKVASQQTAIWLDSKASIAGAGGHSGLTALLNAAAAQQAKVPATPVVVTIVIYDLPARDCNANASTGEFAAGDVSHYESDYINPIAGILSQPAYANLRLALIIEPDSLPNVVSNIGVKNCTTAVAQQYEQGIEYALNAFHPISNVYNFMDISNASWLSWNTTGAASEYQKVAVATAAGYASVDGFVTNVSNYSPLWEPYYYNQQKVGSSAVNTANYYGLQHDVDELSFIKDTSTNNGIRAALASAGFPASSLNFAIDTGRNGWAGPNRPTKASTSTDVNTFVEQSRTDRRLAPSDWCNQLGAGIGQFPWASSATPNDPMLGHFQFIDALLWIKPPGEADGTSDPTAAGYDPMCDPKQPDQFRTSVLTGAFPNTPHAGTFSNEIFTQLLINGGLGVTGGLPGRPTNLTATTGSGTVKLTWSSPASNGGNPITGYCYNYAVGQGANPPSCIAATQTSVTFTGLSNGSLYTFAVYATTSAGAGASAQVTATPNPTVPSSPQNLTATPGSGKVTLNWQAPASNGGSALTGYCVIMVVSAGTSGPQCGISPTATSLVYPGVTNGLVYTFAVMAVNAVGRGPNSNSVDVIPNATVPSPPRNLTATPGNGQVTLNWQVPADNGGSALTGYCVIMVVSAGTSGPQCGISPTATSLVYPGVTNGLVYTFAVMAVNAVGRGPNSNSVDVIPGVTATVPTAPTNVQGTAGNGSATITWAVPASNGGSAITQYSIQGPNMSCGTVPTQTTCTFTGLTNGTPYTFTVTATNAIGTGPGASVTVTPTAGSTVPGAPTGVTGVAGNTSVAVTWAAPTNNGGSAITGYTVTSSGNQTCTTTGALTCTVTGLTNGTAYTFTVKAINAAGTSAASAASASVTPVAATGPTVTATLAQNGSSWTSGGKTIFNAVVTVKNTGTVATKSWTCTWTWSGNQVVVSGSSYNGTFTISGETVTVTSIANQNNAIAAGATTTFGFQVSYTGTNTTPTLTCSAT